MVRQRSVHSHLIIFRTVEKLVKIRIPHHEPTNRQLVVKSAPGLNEEA